MSESSSSEETWPSVLSSLTDRARREGVLDNVSKARGFEEKVRRAQEGPGIR